MQKFGWIIYNGHLPGDKFRDFAEWLKAAADNQHIHTRIIKNNELLSCFSSSGLGLTKKTGLPDFVIFTDKDIYLARQLELLGVRVFNSMHAIAASDDKIATYQALAINKLPIPETIAAPKLFSNEGELDTAFIQQAINLLGFPMILKEAFGSFGEQVYLIKNKESLIKKVHQIKGKPFVFQEFVATSFGKDMRLHVVGNKVAAAMVRHSKNDFRANVTAGGTMTHYQPTNIEKEIAVAATKAIGADFAGIDLLFTDNDIPFICEVNSNAHIHNMYDCTGINVADHIIDYILNELNAAERKSE